MKMLAVLMLFVLLVFDQDEPPISSCSDNDVVWCFEYLMMLPFVASQPAPTVLPPGGCSTDRPELC